VQQPYIATAIFVIVYILIIFGRKGKFVIPIWTSMIIGAAFMVCFQIISIDSAFKSINLDVIGFLFGMFSIVSALDISGVLKKVAIKMLSLTNGNPDLMLMVFVVGMGLLSAFLVNDTIAVLGVPLILHITRQTGIRPQVFLIALSFGITIGSAMTPIGNPQNLLIAIQSGISFPFLTFIKVLSIPTLINLIVTFFILKIYFKRDLEVGSRGLSNNHLDRKYNITSELTYSKASSALNNDNDDNSVIVNPLLAKISIIILLLTITGFIISEVLQFIFHLNSNFSPLSIIALLGATALYALCKERRTIFASVDYSVIIFFVAMFIFTSGLWSSGIISQLISYFPTPDRNDTFQSNAIISLISITLSQILSNVPFVALYNHVMISNGFASSISDNVGENNLSKENTTSQWVMLAASSTIAGNLTILAAASNIIVIESAETRGLKAFSFIEFFKIGAILTLVNIMIFYVFIVFVFH
jgi:Na+/H+ antiporter NhaD/arsenite permease-like protein